MRWIVITALAIGCGTPADLGPFTINYTLDVESGGCTSSSCASYGMSCEAVLSIRITDPNTGAVIGQGPQAASLCEPVMPSTTLCGLENLPPGQIFFDLPPKVLRLEVAAWSADALSAAGFEDGVCPEDDIFDLTGKPLAGYSPQPAFAGAAYFDAGSSETQADVPLACSNPGQLETLDCARAPLTLRAEVMDIESPPSTAALTALPESLLVRAAAVRQGLIDERIFTEIDTGLPTPLLDASAEDGVFTSLLDESAVPNPLCVVVLEQTAQATSTVICANNEIDERIDVNGALLQKIQLDQMLAAIDLQAFPPEGLIVGRVFDLAGTPLPGVSVFPNDAPEAVIEYLNTNRDDTLGDRTFDNGYFIASGVPFGTEWSVSTSGLIPVKVPTAGLVRNQLTLLPIRMQVDETL